MSNTLDVSVVLILLPALRRSSVNDDGRVDPLIFNEGKVEDEARGDYFRSYTKLSHRQTEYSLQERLIASGSST
jgi:hypothetical protein